MTDPKRLHLSVEGQSELTVAQELLVDHLREAGWTTVTVSVVRTQTSSVTHRGGVSSWVKIHREIQHLLGQKSLTALTTIFDFYGFPADAPGVSSLPAGPADTQVQHVERAIAAAVPDRRFLPHLVLHELESWVFAAAEQLSELRGEPRLADQLRADCAAAGGPELVNGGTKTAPSKRLIRYCAGYQKVIEGPLAIAELGVAGLKSQCPHFDLWLSKLEELAKR
ncbi:DUF4276 domain-containing protein [Amycolatopsis sp. AA4]|uniref:DUF4276 family protein n=1 Tax=Actinomycetes TaxID=1760 RepID=UPI0001B5815B|nr:MULTISPECIES: DUF4276 family protein [Actinomycetes]ATY15828.1 DUF4276 domain-containing protein [Amycolatopsis sp. AA4]EFL12146.1 predicted protein [Streptomyces sp. AA4]